MMGYRSRENTKNLKRKKENRRMLSANDNNLMQWRFEGNGTHAEIKTIGYNIV